MKLKNVFSTILVGCSCLVLTGCKATQRDLKKEIDESNDEEVKILWNEEFGGEEYPDVEDFLGAIFMFGHNPFIPKRKTD